MGMFFLLKCLILCSLTFADVNEDLTPVVQDLVAEKRVTSKLLAHLNSRRGVTEKEFRILFCHCACGRITTTEFFQVHVCKNEIIDLTGGR